MIECIRFRAHAAGTLQGFVDLWIEKMGVEIYGCTLHVKDGKRWINLPSKEYLSENGEKKYSPVIRFRDKDHYYKFCDRAKESIDAWVEKNANKPPEEEPSEEEELPF